MEVDANLVDEDLSIVALIVSEYKNNNGESNLQTKADEINTTLGLTVSAATTIATRGASLAKNIVAGVAAGYATESAEVVSAENVSKTYKDETEEIK